MIDIITKLSAAMQWLSLARALLRRRKDHRHRLRVNWRDDGVCLSRQESEKKCLPSTGSAFVPRTPVHSPIPAKKAIGQRLAKHKPGGRLPRLGVGVFEENDVMGSGSRMLASHRCEAHGDLPSQRGVVMNLAPPNLITPSGSFSSSLGVASPRTHLHLALQCDNVRSDPVVGRRSPDARREIVAWLQSVRRAISVCIKPEDSSPAMIAAKSGRRCGIALYSSIAIEVVVIARRRRLSGGDSRALLASDARQDQASGVPICDRHSLTEDWI